MVVVLVTVLDMLPGIVIMALQPQQLFFASGGPGDQPVTSNSSATQCGGSSFSSKEVSVIMRDAFPKKDGLPSFNLATNLIGVFQAVGQILAGLIFPRLSDKFGRKPFMLVFTGFGAIVYLAMFYITTEGRSYWGYCSAFIVSGFLAGMATLTNAYFTDLYESEEERNKWSAITMSFAGVMASIGAVVAIPFKEVGLFHACWLGVGCEAVGFLLLMMYVPESLHGSVQKAVLGRDKKKSLSEPLVGNNEQSNEMTTLATQPGEESAKHEKSPEEQSRDTKRLKWVLFGSIIDSLGSNGFFYALGTVMILRFPCSASDFTTYMALLIVAFSVGAMFATPLMSKCGYGFPTFLGNITACAFQIVLAFAKTDDLFIVMNFVGFAFSVQSMLTTNPMIMKLAPQHELGTWLGYNAVIESATQQFGPMLLAAWYEAFYTGSTTIFDATRNVLLLCAALSFVSTLMAIPTVCWFPPEKKSRVSVNDEYKIEDYEIPEDGTASNIPAAVLDQINEKRILEGLPALSIRFGSYAKDQEEGLSKISTQGHEDFVYSLKRMKEFLQQMKDEPEATKEEVNMYCREMTNWIARPAEKIQEERQDFANWLCDYIEDAGYQWTSAPAFYKAVVMNAFPPIGRIDLEPEETRQEALRAMFHRYEQFAHMHLKMEKAADHDMASYAAARASHSGWAPRKPGRF